LFALANPHLYSRNCIPRKQRAQTDDKENVPQSPQSSSICSQTPATKEAAPCTASGLVRCNDSSRKTLLEEMTHDVVVDGNEAIIIDDDSNVADDAVQACSSELPEVQNEEENFDVLEPDEAEAKILGVQWAGVHVYLCSPIHARQRRSERCLP